MRATLLAEFATARYQALAIVVPACASVVVALIAGLFARTGHQRDQRAGALAQAFDARGEALSALKSENELLRSEREACERELGIERHEREGLAKALDECLKRHTAPEETR